MSELTEQILAAAERKVAKAGLVLATKFVRTPEMIQEAEETIALCVAVREIVEDWINSSKNPYDGWTDDQLHDRYAHSCFEYATTEGQRKRWDEADDPPCEEDGTVKDGWELNITERNPDAFERFDYHEERYWRRRVKDGPHVWKRYVPRYIELLARGYGVQP